MRNGLLLMGLCVIGAGCSENPTDPSLGVVRTLGVRSDGDRLAEMVAGAMAEPEFRAMILQAMRASPFSEHALPLRDLLATPNGAGFVSGLARASGATDGAVTALIASLPPLDFYVPAQADRLSWTEGPSLIVAAMPTATLPRVGYTPDGAQVPLDLAHARPAKPLFYLQFAEHKAYRLEPQPTVAGAHIQDPEDGELAMAFVHRSLEGQETVIQLRDLPSGIQLAQYCPPDIPGCPPADEGGGGSGGDPSPPQPGAGYTYLTSLQTFGECDNGICWEGNEFEFRASSSYGYNVLRWEGVGSSSTYSNIQKLIAPYSPSAAVAISMGLYETDGWPNPDDHFMYVNAQGCVCDPRLQITPVNTNAWTYPLKKSASMGQNDPIKVSVTYWWNF